MAQLLSSPISTSILGQLPSWVTIVLSNAATELLLRLLKHWTPKLPLPFRPSENYEVLNYEASIEVKDSRGFRAIYSKRQKVRFLRDNVTTIYDYGWGTGNAFASHRIQPGRVVERKKVGLRYRTLVMLPEPQNKGDELTMSVQRMVKSKFTGKDNWLEAEVYCRIRRMRLSVILPATRPVGRAWMGQRLEAKQVPISVKPMSQNRQRLEANISKPRIGDMYTLFWHW